MSDETISAYPLCWPPGRPRTRWPTKSNFETTFAVARDELVAEVKRLGGRKLILSTNVALRQDGLPLAAQRKPTDTGVAAYFERNGKRVCFACDRWDQVQDNMRAIVKTIDAIRGIARWGTGDMLEAAFTGFTALPPPTNVVAAGNWWTVLGVSRHEATQAVDIAYRIKRSETHPDRGGSSLAFQAVQQAWDEFCKERGLA